MVKKIKRILVTGAGGAPSTNFIRSLRCSSEKFYIIGVDADKYYLARAESDEKYLIPLAKDKHYITILKDIIEKTKAELIYAQPDYEIFEISKNREQLKALTFLPSHETIKICQDKFLSYKKWKNAGLKVPETVKVYNEKDLKEAFERFGSPIWIRATVSPGAGKDSFKADNIEIATAWINYCKGWGKFTAAKCLNNLSSTTWMSLWKDGELIIAQGRKRLYWEFANRSPSGVTGITGTGVTVSDPKLDEIALKSIYAIDKKPNGIFSVDLTYDNEGDPNPTEINIGRFFTTHFFFTKAGLNMPHIYIKLAYNEKIPKLPKKINPLPQGLCWIRGMDTEPILTTEEIIKSYEKELEKRLKK
jgi:carbamoyl-phosphate synthase large subunit